MLRSMLTGHAHRPVDKVYLCFTQMNSLYVRFRYLWWLLIRRFIQSSSPTPSVVFIVYSRRTAWVPVLPKMGGAVKRERELANDRRRKFNSGTDQITTLECDW